MPHNLKFQGFVGMIDPLRPHVKEAVESCKKAGVRACMITGDHPVTALAIARELGLAQSPQEVVTGQEIKNCSEAELRELVEKSKIFARVAPHEKFRIVTAFRANRNFVAVTGDGVNDAPALQNANIGVAMGKAGTDVARDASDIVISDDNFSTIVGGVEEGRIAYNNVRNVIYLLISTGAAEVLMVALALAFGLPLPLLPAQLLWLNLVTNGIQDVALAFEPGLGDELNKPPRPPQERIFNRLMVERVLVGAVVMGGVGFGAFYHMLGTGWSEESARNAILLLFVLFENFHLGNSRSETRSAFALSPFRGPFLLWGAITATSIHVLFMYLPLGQKLLQTQPLPWADWRTIIAMAFLIVVSMELHKLSWYLRYRNKSP
ncbi:MAG: HAD-IC family P-type ATPase [bacterium]|nr:HAD-IC family P-type ATPase [bacterium]